MAGRTWSWPALLKAVTELGLPCSRSRPPGSAALAEASQKLPPHLFDRPATNLAAVACNLRPQRALAEGRRRRSCCAAVLAAPAPSNPAAAPLARATGGPMMPSLSSARMRWPAIRTQWPQRLRLRSRRMSLSRPSPSAASARFDCRRAPGTLVNSAAMGAWAGWAARRGAMTRRAVPCCPPLAAPVSHGPAKEP